MIGLLYAPAFSHKYSHFIKNAGNLKLPYQQGLHVISDMRCSTTRGRYSFQAFISGKLNMQNYFTGSEGPRDELCVIANVFSNMAARVPRARKREPDYQEKLQQIEQELCAFCDYVEQVGFSPEEVRYICAPYTNILFPRSTLKLVLQYITFISLIAGVIYSSTQMTIINLHVAALGRIFLIQLLPVWDWTKIFYENCLVNNPMYRFSLTENDCITCETLDHIERISDVDYQLLVEKYLSRDGPVIVNDAMTQWPVMKTDNFYFDNVTSIYLDDEKLSDTVPCVLTSNLRPGSSDLSAFLKRVLSPRSDKWFVHWQNCDIHAVKALRKLSQRPYFLAGSVPPAHFNWVLMSSQYNGKTFRRLDVDTGLIIISQLRGVTMFKLSPHTPCNTSCPELHGELHEGEMLVLANYMWSLEYCPGRFMDNVAIITETVWEEYKKM